MNSEGIIAFVGIGSNMDGPAEKCRVSIDHLKSIEDIKVLSISSLYASEPVGPVDQDDFVNAVCEIKTWLEPWKLLALLQTIENQMGRQRQERWGPRIIDLDLLLYGQQVIEEADLVIPHPEFHKRRFVLEPFCEIASYVIHPAFGISMRGLLDRLEDNHRVEILHQA